MAWNNPDAYPGESESEYELRKNKESESSIGLLFMILNFSFLILKIAALYGLFFYAGFLISENILGEGADKTELIIYTIIFTYFIFCIIYFLKGMNIALRAKKSKLWILPWTICIIVCCIVPAFLIKSLVPGLFSFHTRDRYYVIGLSWIAFFLFSLYTYSLYKFNLDIVPKIFSWSYYLGVKSIPKKK
ncbi:hypothetical protein [Chryseobacterium defluvii]|uniref:Uncharacterized protein n=1 Tax=Chryseobacterium defluvii TaxID=160396 RepID=A0A495SQJ2_9FLAO|nr:hypothetical protein [Chryseobacterium defluvii]RKT01772.1 hypothetical protein BCF58_0996 [Chryseobacterium defluvii]